GQERIAVFSPERAIRSVAAISGGALLRALNAASTSMRPNPNTLFGTCVAVSPAQPCALVNGTAVRSSTDSVSSTLPRNSGYADHNKATAPATCGAAIEVPLRNA